MSHVLVITNASGKVIAKVEVSPGYKIREVRAASERAHTNSTVVDKSAGDGGSGREMVN